MKDRRVRRLSSLHVALFRATRGRVGRRLVGNDMLLLTTTGRRTGRAHTVPLLYLEEGDTTVVVASYGGRDHHPSWYLNLRDRPAVEVRKARKAFQATARPADVVERASWWPRVVTAYEGYEAYQNRTDRQIPIVMLKRLPDQKP